MATLLFVLVVGWILLLAAFVWLHIPDPTIAEIVRAVESRR
jgi:hypothetical protein